MNKPMNPSGSSHRLRDRFDSRTVAIVGFATSIILFAGLGFIYKMTEFAMTIVHDEVRGFGAAAIAIYLVGLLPMLFLTLWAVFTGRFQDIEQPKFRMLELDREIERGGNLARR